MDDVTGHVARLVAESEHMLVITGAGISADSGLPTYRGIGGLYEDVHTAEGVPIEVALSGAMLEVRPELTWKYLWQIGAACHAATFNRGHEVIAAIERHRPGTWVLTQNVDGFHRAAGSRNLVEIHGRMFDLRCTACGERFDAQTLVTGYGDAVELPPRCPSCDGVIRPDVVLFGEALPIVAVEAYHRATAGRDLVLSVGTSSVFPYIVEPVRRARETGAPTVEINPGRTEISDIVDFRIESGAAAALDDLWRQISWA